MCPREQKVTLEDLYNGCAKKLRLTKNIICQPCGGKGGKGGKDSTCKDCKGQGVKMVIRQIGPGMIQQAQVHCPSCKGSGSVIADKDKCTSCHGEKTVKEKKTLEVHINKGMKHGEKIVFRGEADEAVSTTDKRQQATPKPCPSLFIFYFLFPSEALR